MLTETKTGAAGQAAALPDEAEFLRERAVRMGGLLRGSDYVCRVEFAASLVRFPRIAFRATLTAGGAVTVACRAYGLPWMLAIASLPGLPGELDHSVGPVGMFEPDERAYLLRCGLAELALRLGMGRTAVSEGAT